MNETVAKRRQDQLEAEQGKTVQPRPRYGQLNLLPQGQHQMAAFTEKRDAEGDPQVSAQGQSVHARRQIE